MSRAITLASLVSFVVVHAMGADVTGPSRMPASRYAAMSEKCPFALATQVAPAGVERGTFAANWFVSGIGRYGDENFVTIKSRDTTVQFTLFGRESHPEHRVSVASVNWSDTIGQSTVILQKGTETAKLEFNQALLRSPPPAPAVAAAEGPAAATGAVTPARSAARSPLAAKAPAKGNTPIVVPAQTNRAFPTAANNAGPIQRRIQIIAQPK